MLVRLGNKANEEFSGKIEQILEQQARLVEAVNNMKDWQVQEREPARIEEQVAWADVPDEVLAQEAAKRLERILQLQGEIAYLKGLMGGKRNG